MPWIAEARNIFDEMVIFVDAKRATSGTVARASKVATRVVSHNADTWFGANGVSLVAQCESDWVFILDYDEQLGPEWQQQDRWRPIVETSSFTHFWLPRRWIVESGTYIAVDPWWPDYQLRFFRNNVKGTTFPSRLHDTIYVPGRGAYLQHLAIHHHVLWLLPRAVREKKTRLYEQLRPGGGLAHLYLHEDYRPSKTRLPKHVKISPKQQIRWMDKLPPEAVARVSCRITGVPPVVRANQLFWIDADVANETSQNLYPYPPFPVRLAYHWFTKATRRVVVFEGHRSGLFPCVLAGETRRSRMAVVAPPRPGEYILQTSIVQDNICWFDELKPDIRREFIISVTPERPKSRLK